MVITQIIGGLGNQLFQYAAGRALAQKYNTEFKLDINRFETYKLHDYSLQHFNIVQNFATPEDVIRLTTFSRLHDTLNKKYLKNYFRFNTVVEKKNVFNEKIFKASANTYLDGYWQSEKYFTKAADTIRKEVTIVHEPSGKNLELATEIKKGNAVSLHIRRGDYVSNNLTNQIHGTCSNEYYFSAIDYILSRVADPIFYIFTDDPAWVTQNFQIKTPHKFVTHNNAATNYEDMRLMSLCKHNIIANSSFSWWGAWLNNNLDKIIIAPKIWYADPIRNQTTADMVPLNWLRL
jgi:hypothetical protein